MQKKNIFLSNQQRRLFGGSWFWKPGWFKQKSKSKSKKRQRQRQREKEKEKERKHFAAEKLKHCWLDKNLFWIKKRKGFTTAKNISFPESIAKRRKRKSLTKKTFGDRTEKQTTGYNTAYFPGLVSAISEPVYPQEHCAGNKMMTPECRSGK